jgi:hypothetical protein
MSASRFVTEASRTGAMPSEGFTRYDHCGSHRAWGLKKGLRRGRRRFEKDLIRKELATISV